MENEIAERIAMALEGIESAIKEQTAETAEWHAEQRALLKEQREAQRKFAAQLGGGPPGGVYRG